MNISESSGSLLYRPLLIAPPTNVPAPEPTRNATASFTDTLPSFLCTVVPMIALAKMWNRSVPTARMPLTPAAISAGVMMKPPPAPMQPVIRPAARPTNTETTKIFVE